jgi:hypothetical protein
MRCKRLADSGNLIAHSMFAIGERRGGVQMRILGDIDPRPTSTSDSPRALQTQRTELAEQVTKSREDVLDVPLKVTDKRYRLECDRLRENEAWQGIKARRSPSVAATAVEEPEVAEATVQAHDRSGIADAPLDLGAVSNDLAQQHRQQSARDLFVSLGYPTQTPRRRAGAPWTVVLVLLMALAGVAGYGYLAMRENGVPVWRLPGVQTALMLHQRMDATESKVSAHLQTARQRSDQLIAAGRERWARWRR